MTVSISAIAKRPFIHRLVVVAATLTPISCSAQSPSCSDERVVNQMKELVLQLLQQDYGLTAMYNLPGSQFDLRAIRTIESDQRHSVCRTDLGMELALNGELKAAMAKPGGNPTETQMMKSMFGNSSRSVDLRYTVEVTDDSKDLYVSIQRF